MGEVPQTQSLGILRLFRRLEPPSGRRILPTCCPSTPLLRRRTSIQARYNAFGALGPFYTPYSVHVILRNKTENLGDPVYVCDRLQTGFLEHPPSRHLGE